MIRDMWCKRIYHNFAKKGKARGTIENYTKDSGSVYIEFSSSINYLFVPLEEGKLSSGEGGRILTVEPVEDTFGVKKERLMTFIDKYYNKLEYTGSYSPVGNANLKRTTMIHMNIIVLH